MNNRQGQKANAEGARSGDLRGGKGRKDDVKGSGIYPVSEMKNAAPGAKVHGEASFGQGDRGAEGYEDAGESGVIILGDEMDGSKKGGQP